MQTIYTRLNMSHNSTKSTANRYVTVSAHFYPGLFLQRGSWSNLEVSYQISTGRPRLKRNHRQEGIPPSWLRLIVSACQCRTDYRCLRNAIVGMRGYSASQSGALQSSRGESRDACVQNGAFRARSRRGPQLTFLSRISCRGRLIAPT